MPDRPAPPARPSPLALRGLAGPLGGVAGATTGSFLVGVGAGELLVWKAWKEEPVRRWPLPAGAGAARGVAMLAGNASALVAGERQAIRLDLVSGEALPFAAPTGGVERLAASPEGAWAALASGREVALYAMRGQKLLLAGKLDTGPLSALEVTSGTLVLAGSEDGLLVALSGRGVEQWRAALGAPLRAVRASPDGRQVAALDATGRLHLLDSGKPRWSEAAAPGLRPCFSSDGALFAALPDGTLAAWSASTGARLGLAEPGAPSEGELAWLAGGTLVSAGGDGSVRLWDVAALRG